MKSKSTSRPAGAPPSADRLDPLDWIGEAGAQPDILRAMDRQAKKRRRRRVTAAISTAALLLAALVWQRPWEQFLPDSIPASASIHVPARRTLADGSVVELKDGAAIKVAFTDTVRRLELTKGEAHFQVTKNPARPFVVAVGNVEIRAVGTAFSVDRSATQVEVLVTEGRVAVDQVASGSPSGKTSTAPTAPLNLAMLDAGHRTVVELGSPVPAPVETMQSADMNQLLAWRVPRLEFSGTPLGEAIPMINAHSRVKLVLGDETLAAVRLSGVLRADNIETLRELLESYGIKSEFRTEAEIVLSRAR